MALAPVSFRVSPSEKRVLQIVAERQGITVSEFLRIAAVRAAITALEAGTDHVSAS